MPLPLPNLDDRRWADLVEEGRALIPFYAPDWSDHNIHDPGITLMELFAWLAEMNIYQLNRIPESHRRKFLALVGIQPKPPQPARTVLSFVPIPNSDQIHIPAFVEFGGEDPLGETTRILTQHPINLVAAKLETIQVFDGAIFREKKKKDGQWHDIEFFGSVPEPNASIYFGFSKDISKYDGPVSLYFKIAGQRKNWMERLRIINEAKSQRTILSDSNSTPELEKGKTLSVNAVNLAPHTLNHHSVRTVWEFHPEGAGSVDWKELIPDKGDVIDDTRAFTLDGRVLLRVPETIQAESLGKTVEPRYYVRCRFDRGAYDAPPMIKSIMMNAVPAEQAVPTGRWELSIGANATISGTPPERGDATRIQVAFDQNEIVQKISFKPDDEGLPILHLLYYQPPDPFDGRDGYIGLELDALGKSDGSPLQMFVLDQKPVVRQNFKLMSLEKDRKTEGGVWKAVWRKWELRYELDASGRVCFHFTLEPTEGVVRFGDGEQGRIPPSDSWILADYRATRTDAGNLSANVVHRLTDSLHNRWILENFDEFPPRIESITNPLPAEGGRRAETLTNAEGRAVEMLEKTQRAVTLRDIEKLAMETPGVELARVSVWPNLYANLPCLKASGVISIVVIPNMPVPRPEPSSGLLCAVEAYLNHRRIVGMRLNVVGPSFREVKVKAQVKVFAGVSGTEFSSKIETALKVFLDPRTGGPDGNGWPFGRNVYRAEILQIIDEVEGVDHVQSLELFADGGELQCGNVSLCPTELATSGAHEIEVIQ